MKKKIYKKKNLGFTFMELMIVLAILSILMMIAIPSFRPSQEYVQKNMLNTTNKIIVSAINYWIKDNIDPSQRPDNFNSKNSQNKSVYEYISNAEILSRKDSSGNFFGKSNLWIDGSEMKDDLTLKPGMMEIKLEKGVLTTSYINDSLIQSHKKEYVLFPLISGKTREESYNFWKNKNYIIEKGYVAILK